MLVRGSASSFPVILGGGNTAIAFTNPIFVDAAGDRVFTAPLTFNDAPLPERREVRPRAQAVSMTSTLDRLRESLMH